MNGFNFSLTALLPLGAATAILVAGVVDDMRSRKFHNWLFLSCCAVGCVLTLALGGWNGMFIALMGFVAGIAIPLPFVLSGMIGAGDMKLLAAFGIVAGWSAVLSVAMLSLVWAAIFGFVRILVSGQGKALFHNLIAIVTLKDRKNLTLHRIPYTVGILFGWLSHLVYQGVL